MELIYDKTVNGVRVVISPLLCHVQLLVGYRDDERRFHSYKDRYCICSKELAIKAAEEYFKTGKVRYWQKHHNEQISIKGNLAYRTGEHQLPENALYEVDWNADELREEYPHEVAQAIFD
jgi:hypothetical protein